MRGAGAAPNCNRFNRLQLAPNPELPMQSGLLTDSYDFTWCRKNNDHVPTFVRSIWMCGSAQRVDLLRGARVCRE
jgi:hypothetical protein